MEGPPKGLSGCATEMGQFDLGMGAVTSTCRLDIPGGSLLCGKMGYRWVCHGGVGRSSRWVPSVIARTRLFVRKRV
jgi:hypothetical protein